MDQQVYSIKLITGEEMIAKVQVLGTGDWDVKHPRILILNRDGQMNFAPVLFLAEPDKSFILSKSAVALYSTNVREEILTEYNRLTSGLTLPPTKKIIMG